jgi:hypothetical protein
MRRKLNSCLKLLAGAAVAMPAIAFAQAGAGLAGTPHDFVNGPLGPTNSTAVGLCTFCHTPHKAQSTRLLWNHTLSGNTFNWSDAATTTGGTTLPSILPAYKGASVRCLSCHDGTVAIGDVSWFAEGPRNGANALNPTLMGAAPNQINNEFVITGGGTGGSDLKGNHPIAVPFPWGNAVGTYNAITTGSAVNTAEWKADPSANGIRLFHDNGGGDISAGAVAGKTGIECSSCHDPHNGASVPATSDFFLRGNYTGADANYLCNKCHTK